MILLIYVEFTNIVYLNGDDVFLFTEYLQGYNIQNVCRLLDNWSDTCVTRIKAIRVVDTY